MSFLNKLRELQGRSVILLVDGREVKGVLVEVDDDHCTVIEGTTLQMRGVYLVQMSAISGVYTPAAPPVSFAQGVG